ncbi:peptide chain release factor 1 [Pneumocystis carinii B80]|uniref:Peptide chain release factor 1 n=1 Tax=Pneumocystis carinii (strain B80) TaxID=1408658 RepID=A0A0W4ZIG5_PNEC8|nr:peptide chain release factor 1 [Pneumocystis carinii B80]KTW28145.1 peptide chain release factor 1 [Pneumocystis carinii B80]
MKELDSIKSLNKKIINLKPIAISLEKYHKSLLMIDKLKQLKHESEDYEMIKLANEEIGKEEKLLEECYNELKKNIIPKHPQAHLPCILEIHAGVGGDEATLFATELLRMYQKYAVTKNWKYEILSINKNEGNEGILEAIMQLDGPGAFGKLKNETGVHRVQRIPITESKGRIHTSTITVNVFPKVDQDKNFDKIDMKEVKIEVMRSRGAGGQHVNKTESAVRMTHLPTGISVSMQDSRSQHQNRSKALIILKSRVAALRSEKNTENERQQRRSQIPSATRPDKIRTYNFPQNRITDHRCGYSLYDLEGCMNGGNGLDPLFDELELWAEQMKLNSHF